MKVSVITVCLNSEKYIEQTINSVLNQTYKDIEYIIIDGGSTDNTLTIIKNYEDKFKGKLKLISEKDNGIYDAMNKGISMASGEIIGIINSDDWYETYTVEKVVETYRNNKESVIYGAMAVIKENNIFDIAITDYKELNYGMISHPTVFVPKVLYKKLGVFDLKYKIAADYELMLRFFNNNINFMFIPKILANFRIGGVSTVLIKKCLMETNEIRKKYNCKYEECKIDFFDEHKVKYLWNKCVEKIRKLNKCNSNIYIYGSGKHTEKLLNYLPCDIKKNIRGIIDRENCQGRKFNNEYKIYLLNEIEKIADIILISSASYESEIYRRLMHLKDNINIVRIYLEDSVEEINELIKDYSV